VSNTSELDQIAAAGEAGHRSDAGDGELGAWRGRLLAQLRHATEDPQGDGVGLHAVVAGHDRVAQLVHEHAREEPDRREPGGDPVEDLGLSAHALGQEHGGEGPRQQPPDDEQAPVEAHPHAGDPADLEARFHGSSAPDRRRAG
jgi:hypothetical protein